MAWENVCKDKEDGGLGVKRLDTQNACLLLKLLHRLHHPNGSAWALWAVEHAVRADLSGDLHGMHWAALRDLLPAYQRITKVSVGDGRNTNFWHDCCLTDSPLAVQFPALHNHYDARAMSVHDVVRGDLRGLFQ